MRSLPCSKSKSQPIGYRFCHFQNRAFIALGVMILLGWSPALAADDLFENEIRPMLVEHCYDCHGNGKIKGGLRLTSRAEAIKGGDTGKAIVPGKPKESLLIQSLHYTGETKMPKKGKLPDAAIAKFSQWVEQGAPWGNSDTSPTPPTSKVQIAGAFFYPAILLKSPSSVGWPYLPLQSVKVPDVKHSRWASSDLDRFILSKLEAKGLVPAVAADKRVLIRRATYDLTGLPPTPEEINAFLQDHSPEAFAKVLDRLLASPSYGEKWGRHWLDVVRYADSRDRRGMGGDMDITEAWRYRDWVINAFNRDYPYDRFVMDQIAGDRLPGPTPGTINADGLTATGLLAIGEWGTGDADKEKMVTDIVNDQIDVVSRGFLGLTVACARCHDHKFDPISQKDYYGLAGIFFSTKILPGPGAKTNGSPLLRTPVATPQDLAQREAYQKRLKSLDREIADLVEQESEVLAKSMLPQVQNYLMAAWEFRRPGYWRWPWSYQSFALDRDLDPAILQRWLDLTRLPSYQRLDVPLRDIVGKPGVHAWRGKQETPVATINTTAKDVAFSTIKLGPRTVSLHPGPKNNIGIVWHSPFQGKVKITGKVLDADPTCGDGIAWRLQQRKRDGLTELAAGSYANGGNQELHAGTNAAALREIVVEPGDMLELIVLPKGDYTCDTTTVEWVIAEIGGQRSWNLSRDLAENPSIAQQRNPFSDRHGNLEVWEFVDAGNAAPNTDPFPNRIRRELLSVEDRANAVKKSHELATAFAKLKPGSTLRLSPAEIESRFPKTVREKLARLRLDLIALRATPPPPITMVLAAQEGGVPGGMFPGIQDVPIHIRGSYTRLGERVPRRFPEVIAGHQQNPITQGSGRLELAQWIASPKNPLTARVIVNRVWAWHFGEGIVRTPSNFGKLGEQASHPELLDFLASKFIEDGWSLKRFHKRIMLSSTYCQASVASEATLRIDPENRLWGRFTPRRLVAEELRDTLLAASGKLDRSMGGLAFADLQTPRRSVYLRTIRSDRSGYQSLFDAADPENPTEKRTVSTVAPQALFLLNHPFAAEQAKGFAARLQGLPGSDTQRIQSAYSILFGREPTKKETDIGLAFLHHAKDPATVEAWRSYAQALFCTNEFVYVD